MPHSLQDIESYAFSNCSSLKEITVDSETIVVGYKAIQKCDSLRQVRITAGNVKIKNDAFVVCKSLDDVKIVSDDASIEDEVFYGSSPLSEVTLDAKKLKLSERSFVNLEKGVLKHLIVPEGTDLSDVYIGENTVVEYIPVSTNSGNA